MRPRTFRSSIARATALETRNAPFRFRVQDGVPGLFRQFHDWDAVRAGRAPRCSRGCQSAKSFQCPGDDVVDWRAERMSRRAVKAVGPALRSRPQRQPGRPTRRPACSPGPGCPPCDVGEDHVGASAASRRAIPRPRPRSPAHPVTIATLPCMPFTDPSAASASVVWRRRVRSRLSTFYRGNGCLSRRALGLRCPVFPGEVRDDLLQRGLIGAQTVVHHPGDQVSCRGLDLGGA